MTPTYFRKRLWNLGFAIREIQEAEYMQSDIEHELWNIMFASSNPSNEDLIEALNECQIYRRSN